MKLSNFLKIFFALNLLVILACDVNSLVNSEPIAKHRTVETKNGKIRGIRKKTLFKKVDYYSFKGIPYAKSPTGELRFKVSEIFRFFIEYFAIKY